MDPNQKMEKYACEAAREAGLKPENFRFMQGVGEAIPLDDNSVDAVISTLVLCSVPDVKQTLQGNSHKPQKRSSDNIFNQVLFSEIKRVLKPGGIFLFIEHVAAEDGTFFRHVQNVLDPLQQVVADGCHLTRNTGLYIAGAGFSGGAEINTPAMYSFPWIIRPHVYGVAYK
ncbi:putative methyltransferase-like protein 7A isoform X1 [Brassica napus]|nr:putative methyltransferase-like protein 7A isoform X1 [Brassica napus]